MRLGGGLITGKRSKAGRVKAEGSGTRTRDSTGARQKPLRVEKDPIAPWT